MTKKVLLGAAATVAMVTAFMVLGIGKTPSYVKNGIPVPFLDQGTTLQGSVTFLTKRNNIDVYDVTFKNGEVKETLTQDKIYLIHIPNETSIIDSPIDLAMTLTGTHSHDVDYYGYRYSDAAATVERRDIAAVKFKDRFPAQFFASAKARAADPLHNNALAAFETANDIVFLPTGNVTGGVRIDPAGALYVIIANESAGIDMNPRSLLACGNGAIDGSEQCDDGNRIDADECTNLCLHGFPIPFGSGSTATGAMQTDVSINITALSSIEKGQVLTYTLTMRNKGENVATLVHTLDDIPSGLTFLPAQSDVSCALATNFTPNKFGCNFGSIAPAQTITIQAKFQVSSSLTCPSNITNTSTAFVENDSNLSNNVDSVTTQVTCPVDSPVCGNGSKEGTEACDDGNTANSDGCSSVCAIESGYTCNTATPNVCTQNAVCGNGTKEGSESCDDGNTANSDGCSATCAVESGYTCNTATPNDCTQNSVCGNNVCDSGESAIACTPPQELPDACAGHVFCPEDCDNTSQPVCGNSVVETSEECDDGNTVDADDCDNTCHIGVPLPNMSGQCGNGTINTDETCDDANVVSGDGCSNMCATESEYRCTGTPSSCISYLDFVKNLADTNRNGTVSDTEALILTLDVADAPDQPYNTVSQFDIDADGDVDNTDVTLILTQLDILAP